MSETLPDDWSSAAISECCDVLDSQRVPLNSEQRAKRKGSYPYFGANGIQDYIDDYIFDGDSILLAEDGGNFDQYADRPIAQWVTGKFWVNNHAHILRAKDGVLNKWVFYSLVHKNILKYINGGTRAKLNQSDLKEIEIALPPPIEQKKIASILTSVDEVIENTQKQIDKLQDLKRATMNELLTKGIGHTEFKDSELGRIPKSWEVRAVGSICKLSSGGTPDRSKQEYWGGEIPWVKTAEINYSRILDTEEKITTKGLANSSAKVIPKGAVVMAMYGQGITRGRVAMLGIDATMNQACLAIVPRSDVTADFLYFSFYMQYESLRNLVQEGAQKNLSAGIIKEVLMPIPNVEEQKEISSTLRSIERYIFRLSTKLAQTQSLKKSLMQDLLTGKVRVSVD